MSLHVVLDVGGVGDTELASALHLSVCFFYIGCVGDTELAWASLLLLVGGVNRLIAFSKRVVCRGRVYIQGSTTLKRKSFFLLEDGRLEMTWPSPNSRRFWGGDIQQAPSSIDLLFQVSGAIAKGPIEFRIRGQIFVSYASMAVTDTRIAMLLSFSRLRRLLFLVRG